MESKQMTLVVGVAIGAAVLTSLIFHALDGDSPTIVAASSQPTSNKLVEFSSLESRIQQLEQQLIEERDARQALQTMLGQTTSADQGLSMSAMIETMQQEIISDECDSEVDAEAEMAAFREEQRKLMIEQMQPEFKIQEFINAGFSKDQASWIVQSETEVQLAQLQAQYAARRLALNDPNSQSNLAAYANDQMRTKLGDENYQRYLEAKGMPTSISVGSVMENSPGANAGLLPGDEILAYDNKRVFSVFGLNRMTASGEEGENVLIEVSRNGESVQLTIPRGPIGVQSNRFGRRR